MFEMRAKMITVGLLGAAAMLPIDRAKADQLGHASWYSLPANITANGEQMDPTELTAAHRSLPFGTRVVVENLANGRSVVVRINDRGPFIGGRIIDLSKAAAASIGMIDAGTAKVRVTTADGNALAALGEATAKAKNGASSAAVAKVDIAPSEMPPKATSAAHKPSLTKSVVAKASARTKYAAKRLEAQARVRVASATKRSYAAKGARSPIRVAASSYGIRAAAEQASSFPSRRMVVASNEHPYAILGSTPGFMEPSRTRRRAG
jgi:peptidoglycan lytic transglycosylase